MTMKKWLSVILLAALTLGSASLTLAAWPSNFEGKPVKLLDGPNEGYFIWSDKDGLHLRVKTKGEAHVFSGRIYTNGNFDNILVKTFHDQDNFDNSGPNEIRFRLTATDKFAGIDFYVTEGQYVDFDLSMDGHKVDANRVFIGRDGWHPGDSKFTILCSDGERPERSRTVIIFDGWDRPEFGPGPRRPHGPRPAPW